MSYLYYDVLSNVFNVLSSPLPTATSWLLMLCFLLTQYVIWCFTPSQSMITVISGSVFQPKRQVSNSNLLSKCTARTATTTTKTTISYRKLIDHINCTISVYITHFSTSLPYPASKLFSGFVSSYEISDITVF